MLGELLIIFIVLAILVILVQTLLYHHRFGRNTGIWIFNIVIVAVVCFIAYTSLPENETGKKMIALILGGVGAAGFILGIVGKKNTIIAKILLSVSMIGLSLFLFFGM
ncbi:hypothetical protein [Sporosarcina sp.]|uniref:hypothetical protein n=1 Tax=Sporosarcina sp. TaxID=49982 RepID=UPI002625CDA4|nr:hypothetical protein [Sporosarcina sp.]